jgi:purine-binding chemotaxis protein CheW
MADRQQFSTFFVDGLCFGIEVEKVQEVMAGADMTRLPLAPPVVRGLINLRGQIVRAIDLRRCLQLEDRAADEVAVNLILDSDDGWVSLLVDHVGEVLEADEDTFELPPEVLQGPPREMIRGVYKLHKGIMHVLNVERTLRTEG